MPFFVTKCLAICETILKASRKGIDLIFIKTNSQLVVNSINGKIHV